MAGFSTHSRRDLEWPRMRNLQQTGALRVWVLSPLMPFRMAGDKNVGRGHSKVLGWALGRQVWTLVCILGLRLVLVGRVVGTLRPAQSLIP